VSRFIETNEGRFVNKTYSNTKSDLIEITDDKLENILSNYLMKYKKSNYWLTALTVVLTILTVILTADFNKDFLNIKKEIWSAIFYIGLLMSIVWLIRGVYFAITNIENLKISTLLNNIKVSRFTSEEQNTSQKE